MSRLAETIHGIGDAIATCTLHCEGVLVQRKQGIVPRGLALEERIERAPGIVVLGMNPGGGNDRERQAFRDDPSHVAATRFWQEQLLRKHQYYMRLHKIVEKCGVRGHILWTELAKCQSRDKTRGSLPLQTYRTCAAAFLRRELECVPLEWGILAVGRDAFHAAGFLFADRSVVGLPHPTGAWGHWNDMNRRSVAPKITKALEGRRAVWLPDELRRRR
jgi:hypothetical protein